MIDVKYFAGFIDADGSFNLFVQKLSNGLFKIYPKVSLSQLEFRNDSLRELADHYEVSVHKINKGVVDNVSLHCNKAITFINLIKNHLVIKRDVAEYILSVSGKEVTEEELKAIKSVVKQLRKKNTPDKNFPSRKWMAGYIDGDGCFYAKVTNKGVLNCKLIIASSSDALAGIELIKKCFGGSIRIQGNVGYYELHISSSKATELYEYIGKHLRIKKSQMELVRNWVGENRHAKSKGATYESNKKFCETLATTKSLGINRLINDVIVY